MKPSDMTDGQLAQALREVRTEETRILLTEASNRIRYLSGKIALIESRTVNNVEHKFFALLAEAEPEHPWLKPETDTDNGPWASEDPSEMCRSCGHVWEQHIPPLPAPCSECACIGFTRKPHVKVLRYRGFEIWLYEDGDGDWQAGLIDNERNDYDHGLTVLNAMEYSIVLGEAKGTCDAIRDTPDWYGDNEEGKNEDSA